MYIQNDSDLFQRIDSGLKKAVRNALLQHKQAGKPIHIWLENQVVEVLPGDIKVDESFSDSSVPNTFDSY